MIELNLSKSDACKDDELMSKKILCLPKTCNHRSPKLHRYFHQGSLYTSVVREKIWSINISGSIRRNFENTKVNAKKVTSISASSSIVARVISCDITRWATGRLTGCPTNTIRFLNNTLERSNGPPGVITAGITGGFPSLASIGPKLLEKNGVKDTQFQC